MPTFSRFSGGILFSGLIKRVSLLVNGLRYLGVASAITMALIGLMSPISGYYLLDLHCIPW